MSVKFTVVYAKWVFTPKFHLGMKLVPGRNHPCPMVKCFLLFTRFCRDEISSLDEKKKKTRVNTSSWDEILNEHVFLIFDVCIQICCPKLTCLNIMKVRPLYKK